MAITSTLDMLGSVVKIARPIHWIKNFAIFAAIFLTGFLFERTLLERVIFAFISFCLTTSSTYIFNDIMDAKRDRSHPTKRERPIAAGKLPLAIAMLEWFLLASISLLMAYYLNYLFFLLTAGYIVLQIFYSLGLKNLPVIDILIIATGFIARVYAGAVVIDAHLSVWFLLCVVSASLFLASGKRRAEINLIEGYTGETRKSLSRYSRELLNSYVTMFGNATWMSWSLYTFFESPKASLGFWLVLAEVSRATTINKLLMATIPIVIFGIMRYESLIFEGKSEAPEKLLLTDKGLILAVTIWTVFVSWILYSGVSIN